MDQRTRGELNDAIFFCGRVTSRRYAYAGQSYKHLSTALNQFC